MRLTEPGNMRRPRFAVSYGSKYEHVIELKKTRAIKPWECYECGAPINPGDYYFRQSLGNRNKPPRMQLVKFCLNCNDSPLATRIHMKR